jgi:hypothetical protein
MGAVRESEQARLGHEGNGEREVERAGVSDWAGVLGLLSLFYFLSYFQLTQTKTI